MVERPTDGPKPDAAARTPKPLVAWFVLIDLLLAAALVFVGVKVGGVMIVIACVLAAGFAVAAFLHGWLGLRSR